MLDKVLGSKVANFSTILGGAVTLFTFYLSFDVMSDSDNKYSFKMLCADK